MKKYSKFLASSSTSGWPIPFVLLLALEFLSLWSVDQTLRVPFSAHAFFLAFGSAAAFWICATRWSSTMKLDLPIWTLLFITLLLRFAVLTPISLLSTDSYRYAWDGNLLLHGFNPLGLRPDDPRLLALTKFVSLPPDHRDIPSVYPPVAQLVFAIGQWIHSGPLIFPILATGFDVVTTWILARFLKRSGKPTWPVLLFAAHPLAAIESAHSGHIDSAGLLFFSVALTTSSSLRWMLGAVLAALTKLWPILLIGMPQPNGLKKKYFFGGIFITAAICSAAWLSAQSVEGLWRYARDWEFHGAAYSVFRLLLSARIAHLFCAVLLGSVAAVVFIFVWKRRLNNRPLAALIFVTAFLFLWPTVHPWYALWLLPPLVLRPNGPLLYLTLAIATSYAVLPNYLSQGAWLEPTWPRWVTYAPVLVWLALPLFYDWQKGRWLDNSNHPKNF